MADWLSELLCPLSYEERIVKGQELLSRAQGDLTVEERARIAYFIAHAHRQLFQPSEALSMCEIALDWTMPLERRVVLLECQAMSLYDLGRLTQLNALLDALDSTVVPVSTEAHVIALRGCLASYVCDPIGFQYFGTAETLFDELGYEFSRAWVQRSAASLALKIGDADACLRWAGRITFADCLVVAQLFQAEALGMLGRWNESESLVAEISTGILGPLGAEDQVRMHYLQAVHLVAAGRHAEADAKLGRAADGFADLQRQDIDLCDAINRLRNKLRRGEVAFKS